MCVKCLTFSYIFNIPGVSWLYHNIKSLFRRSFWGRSLVWMWVQHLSGFSSMHKGNSRWFKYSNCSLDLRNNILWFSVILCTVVDFSMLEQVSRVCTLPVSQDSNMTQIDTGVWTPAMQQTKFWHAATLHLQTEPELYPCTWKLRWLRFGWIPLANPCTGSHPFQRPGCVKSCETTTCPLLIVLWPLRIGPMLMIFFSVTRMLLIWHEVVKHPLCLKSGMQSF